MPHLRALSPHGQLGFEASAPADELLAKVKEVVHRGVQYSCPMHPEVREQEPGPCPICGMALQPAKP